jgi:hypothetical protein
MTFARRLAHADNTQQHDSAPAAFNELARTFAARVSAPQALSLEGRAENGRAAGHRLKSWLGSSAKPQRVPFFGFSFWASRPIAARRSSRRSTCAPPTRPRPLGTPRLDWPPRAPVFRLIDLEGCEIWLLHSFGSNCWSSRQAFAMDRRVFRTLGIPPGCNKQVLDAQDMICPGRA